MTDADISGSDGALSAEFAGFRLRLDGEVLASRPGLKSYQGKTVVLGIRPEDMQDASLVNERAPDRTLSVTVDIREALGSEVLVHFGVDAPPVLTDDTKELIAAVGEAPEQLEARTRSMGSTFVARLHPETEARERERLDILVDTRRLHFFDPVTSAGIYGEH
jgi:multiple sugar transport system ATP-binding protein